MISSTSPNLGDELPIPRCYAQNTGFTIRVRFAMVLPIYFSVGWTQIRNRVVETIAVDVVNLVMPLDPGAHQIRDPMCLKPPTVYS